MTAEGLEAFRRRQDWSQSELASRLGCDRKTLSRYLTGATVPIPKYIALACSALAESLPPME
jgi:transcriptional regulator with XRE-family HTH domain